MSTLIIKLCKKENKLHYDEFVRPIINILKHNNKEYDVIHFSKIKENQIENYNNIILSGTPLKDNEYLKEDNNKYFTWIKSTNKPILGICAGAQILLKIYGGKQEENIEIGLNKLQILKEDEIIRSNDSPTPYRQRNF